MIKNRYPEEYPSLTLPRDNLILGDRACKSIYTGDEFSNCEVCWTCCQFNFSTNNCRWVIVGGKPLHVNKPGWFRCIYWGEKNEEI